MSKANPVVVVSVKVHPKNVRYDLLDLAANGELIAQIGPRTGDFAVTIEPALVSPDMLIQARGRGVSGAIAFAVFAWSSAHVDDPSTPDVDERWTRIGVESGEGELMIEDEFNPFPPAGAP